MYSVQGCIILWYWFKNVLVRGGIGKNKEVCFLIKNGCCPNNINQFAKITNGWAVKTTIGFSLG